MPILEIEVVGEVPADVRPSLASRIADGAAELWDAEPASVWVRLRFTERGDYAENGAPDGTGRPVFVKLLKHAWPGPEAMREEVRGLSTVIGAACGRPPDRIHIFYDPPGAGRVAFGGRLVE